MNSNPESHSPLITNREFNLIINRFISFTINCRIISVIRSFFVNKLHAFQSWITNTFLLISISRTGIYTCIGFDSNVNFKEFIFEAITFLSRWTYFGINMISWSIDYITFTTITSCTFFLNTIFIW